MTKEIRKPECRKAVWCAMARSSFGFRYSFGFPHSSFGFENRGSWRALFLFCGCIGTMNRTDFPKDSRRTKIVPYLCPPGRTEFRPQRFGDAKPPKGGIPYQRRFIENAD